MTGLGMIDAAYSLRQVAPAWLNHTIRAEPKAVSLAPAASNKSTAVRVSSDALVSSDLFDAASSFVRAEHLEPFSGYDRGTVSLGGYISIEKYNNYLFDKAASAMVSNGQKAGLSLNKDDIVTALKTANKNIAILKDDYDDRVRKLGPASVLIDLSISDLGNLTDIYIKAKERGLDTDQVEVVAAQQGMVNRDKRLGIRTVTQCAEYEVSGDWGPPASEKVSSASNKPFDKLKTSLYDAFGLSTAMINTLVDSVRGGSQDLTRTLAFIQGLLS